MTAPGPVLEAGQRDYVLPVPNFAGVLPAAGDYTDQDYSLLPPFTRRVTVLVNYVTDAAASAGQAKFKVQWAVDGFAGFFETFLDASAPTIGPPEAEVPEYELVALGPAYATGITGNYRLLSLEAPSGVTGVRVIAAEIGDTAHPGDLTITIATSNEI